MSCLICGSKDIKRKDCILREGATAIINICPNCQLEWINSNKDMKDYYNNEYRNNYISSDCSEIFNKYLPQQSERIERIKPYLKKYLLDVGCSSGQFLYSVKNLVNITGVELDQKSAMYAKNKCDCEIYEDLKSIPADMNFDIITSFLVMEHTTNPIEFISDILKHLKQDGIINIEVPNSNDILLDYNLHEYNKAWYREAHLFYFSEKSLLQLMKKCGLEGYIYYHQDYDIFNHIGWLINGIGFDSNKTDKEIIKHFKNANIEYKKHLESIGKSAKIGFIAQKRQ
jgi:2-polyprenyl-3-methyl-5-hydroxy-6-metoxy-1,4-benzoquinol methylase